MFVIEILLKFCFIFNVNFLKTLAMRHFVPVLSFILLFAIGAKAQYEQVPFCAAKGIITFSAEHNKAYKLFSSVQGFRQAYIFDLGSGKYQLLVMFEKNGKLYLQEYYLDRKELDSLQNLLCSEEEKGRELLDRRGKAYFIIGSTVSTLGGYTWMVPVMVGSSDIKVNIALGSITTAAGIWLPSFLVRNTSITWAEAYLKNHGQFTGFLNGLLWANLFNVTDFRYQSMFMVGTSIAQAAGGYIWAHLSKMTFDEAFTVTNYGFLGSALAVNLGFIPVIHSGKDFSFAYPLAGQYLGYLGGYLLDVSARKTLSGPRYQNADFAKAQALNKVKITSGDNLVLDGLYFHALGWVTDLFITINDTNLYKSMDYALLGTGLAAVAGGTYYIRKTDYTFAQGIFANLAGLGGGMTLTALTALAVNKDAYKAWMFTNAYMIGSTAGFGFMLYKYSRENSRKPSSASLFDVNFSVNPAAYAVYQRYRNNLNPANPLQIPAFSLNVRF